MENVVATAATSASAAITVTAGLAMSISEFLSGFSNM